MAKKTSFIGTFGGNPKTRMSNVVAGDRLGGRKISNPSLITTRSPYQAAMPTGFRAKAPKDQSRLTPGMPKAAAREQITTSQRKLGVTGGLGLQGYMSPGAPTVTTSRKAATKTRNAVYGSPPPANPVNVVRDVVRTVANMKTTPAKASRAAAPVSVRDAQGMRPGNYGGKSVTMGGKTYKGFTVNESRGRSGQTTKSVGNWSSTPNAGRTMTKSGVAGPGKDSSGRNRSSATGKGAFGGGKKK